MFRWIRGRRESASKKYPERELAPVEDIAEQGVLVAEVAARLTVKNAIIMNALAKHVDYSEADVSRMVRETLLELAEEREGDANRLTEILTEIQRFGHGGWAEGDYTRKDRSTLEHRRAVYLLVASELRNRAADATRVAEAAERARKEAWTEIGDALKTKAEHPYYGGGRSEDYLAHRDERIQKLIENDLTQLVKVAGKSGRSKKD